MYEMKLESRNYMMKSRQGSYIIKDKIFKMKETKELHNSCKY